MNSRIDHILFAAAFPSGLVRLCITLLLCACSLNAQPSRYTFLALHNDTSIAVAEEHTIIQDSRGFLWVGTFTGLYRYDGYEFKQYWHGPIPKESPWLDYINCVFEDRAGDLWVGSPLGLDRLDRKTGRFRRYAHDPSDSASLIHNNVNCILESADGRLWIGTAGGLDNLDGRTDVFTHFLHDSSDPSSLGDNDVTALLQDRSGVLWLGHWASGLDSYDPQQGRFHHYRHDPADSRSLCDDRVRSLYETSDGGLWVGTAGGGLDRLDRTTGHFAHFRHSEGLSDGLSDNNITTLLQSSDGTFWVGTSQGGLCWSSQADGMFHPVQPDPFGNRAFAPANITSLHEDRSGNLWVGSWRGIRYLDALRPKIVYDIPQPEGRGGPFVRSLLQDTQGSLWVGTGGGLSYLDRERKTYRHFRHLPGDLSNPTDSWIDGLCEDSRGTIWIACMGGLYALPKGAREFTQYKHDPADSASLRADAVSSVCIDRTGSLWVGGGTGVLEEFDHHTGRFRHHLRGQTPGQRRPGVDITAVCGDRMGIIWAGTYWDGLDAYDRGRGTFTHYAHDSLDPGSLSSDYVSELLEDSQGQIWVRFMGGGLDRFNRQTGSFEHFTANSKTLLGGFGPPVEDRTGKLWFSMGQTIFCLDPESRTEQMYYLPSGGDPTVSGYSLPGVPPGNYGVILPTLQGLVSIYPDSIKRTPQIYPVAITSFKVFNAELNLDSAVAGDGAITLAHMDNAISVDFAVLDYADPQRNEYACMLEGVDRDWVQFGKRHYAQYVHLDPGEYLFRVKGRSAGGLWNEQGTSLRVVIIPPFWKTRLAYMLYGAALLSILYGTWRLQMRRVKLRHAFEMTKFQAEKLHEVDELKNRFFANISHEFRTPLTLILGPVRQLGEDLEDANKKEVLKVVHRNASRLLDLVNQLLDLSKLESGNMKLQAHPHDMVHLVQAFLQSFCPYAERKRIALNFQSTEQEVVAYIDRDKIEKVLANVLSNAFKFTPEGGRVDVSVTKDTGHVDVRVSDTGIGIPREKISLIFDRFYQVDGSHTREQEGTGIGLSLTRELVELHRGTIAVESEEGHGSVFTIRLPLGKAHLKPEETHEVIEEEERIPARSGLPGNQDTTSPAEVSGDLFKETGKPVLLIVEDNDDVRQYIRCDLEAEYRVLEARDGDEGWDVAVRETPDIIVSDVMMPRMNGFEFCKMLKTDEQTSHIPVILLTAKAASHDRIEGYETGADDYITKPFEPPELKARLSNLLEQRKRVHEHFRKHGLFEVETGKVTPVDRRFLERLMATIAEKMSDPSFGVERLAESMAVSRSLLLKKLEALIGEPPTVLIRQARLKKAAQLIGAGFGNVSQVALEVGFNNPSYFAECFRKQFGVAPSEFKRGE